MAKTFCVFYEASKVVEINPDNYATPEDCRNAIIEEAQREAGFGFDVDSCEIVEMEPVEESSKPPKFGGLMFY